MVVIITFYLLMAFACYPVIRGYWFDILTSWVYKLDDEDKIKYYTKKYSNIKEDKITSFFFALCWPFVILSYYNDSKEYPGSLIFTDKVYR
jgi:hypothetical protein